MYAHLEQVPAETSNTPSLNTSKNRSNICSRCGRPLKSPASVEAGMGPVCRGHSAAEHIDTAQTGDLRDTHINRSIEDGIILQRGANGVAMTNVPHVVVNHSPTGFEWGYAGSGPADLALNICMVAYARMNGTSDGDTYPAWDGTPVPRKVWNIYQDFKQEFIASAGREGRVIHWQSVLDWVAMRVGGAPLVQMELPFDEY